VGIIVIVETQDFVSLPSDSSPSFIRRGIGGGLNKTLYKKNLTGLKTCQVKFV